MNKSELVLRIAAHSEAPDLPASVLASAVDAVLAQMADSLARGDRIEIRGFGSFGARIYRSTQWRNPGTGAVMTGERIRCRVMYRPSKRLIERVQE